MVIYDGGLPGRDRGLFDGPQLTKGALAAAEMVLGPAFERPKRPNVELEMHCPPTPALCVDAVADLNGDDVFAIVSLAGLVSDMPPDGCDASKWDEGWASHLMGDYSVTEAELASPRGGVELLQSVVAQVAGGGGEVELTSAQVQRLRSPATARFFLLAGAGFRIGLVELCDPSELDRMARELAGRRKGGLARVASSWWARSGGRDVSFEHNWILARAASHVMDCCVGLAPEHIRQCPKCGQYWVQKPVPGGVRYCPECRRDHSEEERKVKSCPVDGRPCVMFCNRIIDLDLRPGSGVTLGDTVTVKPWGDVHVDPDDWDPLIVLERRFGRSRKRPR